MLCSFFVYLETPSKRYKPSTTEIATTGIATAVVAAAVALATTGFISTMVATTAAVLAVGILFITLREYLCTTNCYSRNFRLETSA